MTHLRILALLPFLYKGALSIEVFRAMSSRGIDVTVAYCDDISGSQPYDDMADFRAENRLLDLTASNTEDRRNVVRQALQSRNIDLVVQVGAYDLYHHLPYWKEEFPQLRIADILYNEVGHTINHFLYEACIDAVLVESEFMAAHVRRASSKETPWIEIVHSGIDLASFAPPSLARTEQRPLTLGFLGRISPEKNPIGFVDIAERLLTRHPNVRFLMYGTGPDTDLLRRRIAESPHHANIRHGGFVEESRTALNEFDALVLPSKIDGRPVVIMEANGCGVPVLGAPVGGVPELIVEDVNGYLIAPQDIDAFDAVLSQWTTDPSTLFRLKQGARAHAMECFDNRRMFDDYALAFRRISALKN